MSRETKDEGCIFQYMVEASSSSRGLLKICRFLEWEEDDEDGDDGHGYLNFKVYKLDGKRKISSLLFLILLILGTWRTCHKDLVKSNDFFVMAVISFAQIPAFRIYLGIRIVAIHHELGVPVEDIIHYKFFSVTKFGAFITRDLSDVKAPNWNKGNANEWP
ncbi:hypothetical protein SO802_004382 [Lithocarpus litseifolius]|uniref:Uncharacterized protein n=1 Tax=Lithocarpus litseifolius TaxID=425828 RepID=A0AAW2E2W1_9ROSI